MENQKNLFSIPSDVTYLNCAYMGPLLKTTERAGSEALVKKATPWEFSVDDFFEPVEEMKQLFARLIDCDEKQRIVVIPSASYGIATAINNLTPITGGNIILIEHQFPSNVYAWQKFAATNHMEIRLVRPNNTLFSETDSINHQVLANIDNKTVAVACGHIHWADGGLFDLMAIREKTAQFGAALIIDGTQSVGALPFSVKEIQPDALIVASYKWLLGPYSHGLAYFSERFDKGRPIEENWINRKDSEVFQKLVNYQIEYKPYAQRYNVGEMSNFVATPMMISSLTQILDWGVEAIQNYSEGLLNEVVDEFHTINCKIDNPSKRSSHLFGVHLPANTEVDKIKERLKKEQVYVSFRGEFIRVSTHLYNEVADLRKLITVIKQCQ